MTAVSYYTVKKNTHSVSLWIFLRDLKIKANLYYNDLFSFWSVTELHVQENDGKNKHSFFRLSIYEFSLLPPS